MYLLHRKCRLGDFKSVSDNYILQANNMETTDYYMQSCNTCHYKKARLWSKMYMYHVHPKVLDFIFVLNTNYYLSSVTRRLWLGLCRTIWSVWILFKRLINILQNIFSWLSVGQKLLLLQPININTQVSKTWRKIFRSQLNVSYKNTG